MLIARVVVLAVFAFLHTAYFVVNYTRGLPSLGVDGEVYRDLALQYINSPTLLGEQCRNVFWTPWYVIIAALGAWPPAVFAFNLACKLGMMLGLSVLARLLLFPTWANILLMAGYGFYWPTFDYCIFFHYEIFISAVMVAVVVFLTRYWDWVSKRIAAWAVLGIITGIGLFAHTRVVGAFLLVPAIWLLAGRSLQHRWSKMFVYVVVAILPSLFWGYRNHRVIDQWVFSSTSIGYNLYVGHNPMATGMFMPQPPYPPQDKALGMALDYIKANPGKTVAITIRKIGQFFKVSEPDVFGPRGMSLQEWILIPLAVAGMLLTLWRLLSKLRVLRTHQLTPEFRVLFSSLWLVAVYVAFHAVFYNFIPRFRIPVIPFFCLFAVWLIVQVLERLKGRETDVNN